MRLSTAMNTQKQTTKNCLPDWTLSGHRYRYPNRSIAILMSLLLLLAGTTRRAQAQADNFDSYSSVSGFTAAGWILSALSPALVTTTFPPVGAGKGLRIQANPVPTQAPAVGLWYRTNLYTDFYVAIDIVSWPGTDLNQAAVMFARMTDATTGTVVNNQNPANAQGLICNYDTSQYGENPGDRRQGQFQINVVSAGFNTTTIAVAEITFVPGRPYRLVFKGTGWHYIAQAYDWNDLTTPLVTIEADDTIQANPSGACGLLAFSRQGNTGVADMTLDNYYAGAKDPNLATPPALSHPVPGTPVVAARVPAGRWQNFFNPSTALGFTANSYSTNVISAAATRFYLNGQDLSSRLNLSTNGTTISGSLPTSVLTSNQLYSAAIIVSDVAGLKSSTNIFWFDTFSDAYLLSSAVKTVEAEEYNFNGGSHQLDPIPVSGIDTNGAQVNGAGVGYYDLVGTADIDFLNHNAGPDANFSAFRSSDAVRTLNGGLIGIDDGNHATEYDPGSDNIRSPHAAAKLLEYVVARTEPGEWLDYTRKFSSGLYAAYLRYSSFGATSNELYLVTSDPGKTNQTTVKLGTFAIANNMRWVNYLYTPLHDDTGAAPLLNLGGTNTLRLQIAGTAGEDNRKAMLNYIMFVQIPIAAVSSSTVAGPYVPEPNANVNLNARTITVPVSERVRFYQISSTVGIPIKSITLASGSAVLGF
jgi:hypothetical protein